MRTVLTVFGITSSVLYISFFIHVRTLQSTDKAILPFLFNSDLNAVGDFFAGLFSPLAFFWLVIGYFLQMNAIRLQQLELEQQREELKETNRIASVQAELTKRQISLERSKTLPFFSAGIVNHNTVRITNRGSTAFNTAIRSEGEILKQMGEFERDQTFEYPRSNLKNGIALIQIQFMDQMGQIMRQKIDIGDSFTFIHSPESAE